MHTTDSLEGIAADAADDLFERKCCTAVAGREHTIEIGLLRLVRNKEWRQRVRRGGLSRLPRHAFLAGRLRGDEKPKGGNDEQQRQPDRRLNVAQTNSVGGLARDGGDREGFLELVRHEILLK